jgi:hypothetical protein
MTTAAAAPETGAPGVEAEAFHSRVMRAVIAIEAGRLYEIGKELKKTGRAATGRAVREAAFRLDDSSADFWTGGMWTLAQEIGEEHAIERLVRRDADVEPPAGEVTIAYIAAESLRINREYDELDEKQKADAVTAEEGAHQFELLNQAEQELRWSVLKAISEGRVDPAKAAFIVTNPAASIEEVI